MKFDWLHFVEKVAPEVLLFTPFAAVAPFVALAVNTAEQIPGASSEDKLKLAKVIVNAAVAGTNAKAGHTEIDPVTTDAALEHAINTVVATVNAVKSSKEADKAEGS